MNNQVNQFIEAVKENSKGAFEDGLGLEDPVYVAEYEGYVTLSDSYERFFGLIYKVTDDGEWSIRKSWESNFRPYSFEQAMADASIMYTG